METKNCLIEIGTEELPFSAQKLVLQEAENILSNILTENKISFQKISVFVTPCRITMNISGIPESQLSEEKEVLGPPKKIAFDEKGNPTKALFGFLDKTNTKIEDLIEKKTDRGFYLAAKTKSNAEQTIKILPQALKEFIGKLPFAKMMIWNDTKFKFIRPIRWILSMLGDENIAFEIAGIKSGNITYKIGWYRAENIEIKNINQYFEAMKNEKILLDYNERKQKIKKQIANVIKNHGQLVSNDEDLLDEVTALVEYPTAVLCEFDPKFLKLPFEVIYTVLKHHQKCFALQNNNEKLINNFVAICNGKGRDLKLVKTGYEKVAVARLDDAVFFFEKDKKIELQYLTKKLKNLIYQEKLGSVYDKIERVKKIAEILKSNSLDSRFHGNDSGKIEQIITLCKNDLLTDMVGEFPELQGTMGKYYALASGQNEKIALAIEEHYLPRFAVDKLPTTIEGSIVSISDKIDNIISSFLLDKKPTGSKDPFGIRRQVNGIMNILKNENWQIDLNELIDKNINVFLPCHARENGNSKKGNNPIPSFNTATIEKTKSELKEFLHARIENWLIEEGFRIDVVRAVIYNEKICSPVASYKKCKFIAECVKSADFLKIACLYKRANNILKQAKSKNIDFKNWKIKEDLFIDEEKNLFNNTMSFHFNETSLKSGEYKNLKISLDAFFDKVMVMDNDEKLRNNRLALLNQLVMKFKNIADLSEITTE